MKSLITTTIVVALSLSGAMSARGKEAPPTPGSAALPTVERDEQELERALVQQQVEVELRQKIDAAARAKALDAQRQVRQQLTKAQRVELTQASAPVAPGAPPAVAGRALPTPAPAFQNRLQHVVRKGSGGPGRALVIRTSDADAKAQGNLEEDLAVMSRIFDKTLAQKLDEDRQNRFMGINVLFGPGSSPIRSIYLEGYGALFLLNVNFPLLPPPEKPEQTKDKSETDSTWEKAKRELYGQHDAWSQVGSAFKFSMAGGAEQEYDEKKVEDLKEGLLEAIKNATNIRNLKSDETITVCVFGGASAAPGKAKAAAKTKRVTVAPDDEGNQVLLEDREDGTPTHGTIMTIRAKKSDADAFARGKLNLNDFRKKTSITTYAGDTGGWSGPNWFGLTAP
ncbi:MAG: hypothetical protein DME18_16285 [Verrucomicrobia bacterium]|nr:MAG: hypothetical protein DME18_16285 [Verrucomicrobiota bacterium]